MLKPTDSYLHAVQSQVMCELRWAVAFYRGDFTSGHVADNCRQRRQTRQADSTQPAPELTTRA